MIRFFPRHRLPLVHPQAAASRFSRSPLRFIPGIIFCVLASLPFLFAQTMAHAAGGQSGFECLARSQARSLSWNGSWQSDQQDEGVNYRIAGVSPFGNPTITSITLELGAIDSAQRTVRYLSVGNDIFAREVCLRIFGASLPPSATPTATPRTPSASASPTPTRPLKPLRFISFSGKSWVLADAPPKEALSVCTVLNQQFLCRENDKQKYGAKLKDLEQELILEQSTQKGN